MRRPRMHGDAFLFATTASSASTSPTSKSYANSFSNAATTWVPVAGGSL
jgi:hypothetical protein